MSALPETTGLLWSRHWRGWNILRPRKDDKVKGWPIPRIVRIACFFIVFASYYWWYWRFIKNFASIVKHLHHLTWSTRQGSFDQPSQFETEAEELSALPETSGVLGPCHWRGWNISCSRKINNFNRWPIPKTVRDVRSFIVFANY